MTTTARAVAWRVLIRIDHEGAYANLALRAELDRSGLEPRDRRFVTDLVYGTTRMRRACDALIDPFLLREPPAHLRSLLRLGAYQLGLMRVPPHAAVDATVALAPRRARGFVNAVLRKVAASQPVWPDEATQLSYPDWIVERLIADLGPDDAKEALERMNQPASVHERPDGYVQDPASQWVAELVGAQAGELVFDACAGPGGKATALAANGATVIAADLHPARTGLVVANARALGSDVIGLVADATAPAMAEGSFDRVLLDAPCSGLGALRRRADARWRVQPADVTHLASLQRRMLAATAPLLRPGGLLVYSVCTLTVEESVAHPVPDGFEAVVDPLQPPWRPFPSGGDGRAWALYPQDADTDGMVVLRYRRRA